MKKLLILGIVAALACAAYAVPTFTAQTGGVNLPSTAVAPAGQLQFAADYYNTENDATYPLRVVYGVIDGLEVGASYASTSGNAWSIGGKYKLPASIALAGLDWAVGAQYVTIDSGADDTKATQLYLAAGKALTEASAEMPGITGTLGVNWTKIDMSGDDDESAFRFFAEIEAAFQQNFSLAAEFQTKSDDLGEENALWGAALRYAFTPELVAQAGITNGLFGVLGGSDSKPFVGVSYAFSPAAK